MKKGNPGFFLGLPSIIVLVLFFVIPLVLALLYSFQQPQTFKITSDLSLQNYKDFFGEGYYSSFGWSVLIAFLTTAILFVICYPCAQAMAKVFAKKSLWITLLLIMPIFVTINIRMFGWTLILLKGGYLHFLLDWIPGMKHVQFMYNFGAILLGMVNIFLPFMLFPMELGFMMVDDEAIEAAKDLGAKWWQIILEVELPMASAGIFIGALLVFILSLGSMVETQVMGGGVVVPFAEEVHMAFSYQQNWPLGTALSAILLFVTLILIIGVLRYVDLDKLLGSRAKLG